MSRFFSRHYVLSTRTRHWLVIFCFLATAATTVLYATPPYVPGEIIVHFRTDATPAMRMALAHVDAPTVHVRRTEEHADYELWRIDDTNVCVETWAAEMTRNPAVAFAEPNYIYSIHKTPNDPLFPELWGLHNTGQHDGVPGADISATAAWHYTVGTDIIVAVIDTGVDYTHPDLVSNMWRNPGEVIDGTDNDGNGYVDDIFGINPIDGTSDPLDNHGHGTHVAGTIAAQGNNNEGIVGVCWHARIMALRAFNDQGYGDAFAILETIDYAINHGARIINASWGGASYSYALVNAIGRAQAADVLFVAAAGNGDIFGNGINNDITPHYPASYSNENIIAVAASDRTENLTWFSNYGSNSVHLAAPGRAILSCVPGGGYESWGGTSMATPHVVGAAALLLSFNPHLRFHEIKDTLLTHVDVSSNYIGKLITGGRLNVAAPLHTMSGIFFDLPHYFPGATAEIMLVHAAFEGDPSVVISLTTDAGDAETLTLYPLAHNPRIFTNALPIAYGAPILSNGVIEGIHSTRVFAAHHALSSTGMTEITTTLHITVPLKERTVPFTTDAVSIVGFNNGTVPVYMYVSNTASHASAHFIATNEWETPLLPLADATDGNPFIIAGENIYGSAATTHVYVTRLGPTNSTHFVALNGIHLWPYDSWQNAATNITAAVNTAPQGNTILVRSGVYNEDEIILTRAVSLIGVDGPETTIITPRNAHRCLSANTPAYIAGITLQGGTADNGGGVYLAHATMSNCVIQGNTSLRDGGGIYLTDNAQLIDCRVLSNTAQRHGGGVFIHNNATVETSTLSANHADTHGGGAYLHDGGMISRSYILDNTASDDAGGVYLYGFRAGDTPPLVTDSLIAYNHGQKFGGGAALYYSGKLQHCTIVSNYTTILAGGGVSTDRGGAIHNTIIYHNTAPVGDNYFSRNQAPVFSHTCTTPLPAGEGNISDNPLFTQDGAWQLVGASPVINAASPLYTTNTYDLTGAPRLYSGIPDMGAVEWRPAALQCFFTADETTVMPDEAITFTAYVWGTNTADLTPLWRFGDDNEATDSLTVMHTYEEPGVYTVQLHVSNAVAEHTMYIREHYIDVLPEPSLITFIGLIALFAYRRI